MLRRKPSIRRFVRRLTRPRVLAAALLLCGVYIFLQSPPLWFVHLRQGALPQESDAQERVLVIAPHPDDDILGAGSSIAAFREQGTPVLVVFLTSGDANLASQWLVTMDPFLFKSEFRAMGARRQKEAVVALGRVGVSPDSCLFLNYPDQGLTALLGPNWSTLTPYRSPYTGRSAKYSSVAFNPRAPYCGEALLADLEEIIASFRPTIVYLPHPLDAHSDHRAGYAFSRRAVEQVSDSATDFSAPALRCYLVHSYAGKWPTPSAVRDIRAMVPLDAFLGLGTWHETQLTTEEVGAKYRALRAHASQWWTSSNSLSWFICSNELYMVEDS
jgi:LmbE family N-acetylglucosaminyl deacetylase